MLWLATLYMYGSHLYPHTNMAESTYIEANIAIAIAADIAVDVTAINYIVLCDDNEVYLEDDNEVVIVVEY